MVLLTFLFTAWPHQLELYVGFEFVWTRHIVSIIYDIRWEKKI